MGKNLSLTIPEAVKSPLSCLPNRQTNSFHLNEISSEEIAKEINQLNPAKSVGPFSMYLPRFLSH